MLDIILDPLQRAIFRGLSQNKFYSEIALELNLTTDDVQLKVNAVFMMMCLEESKFKIVDPALLIKSLN